MRRTACAAASVPGSAVPSAPAESRVLPACASAPSPLGFREDSTPSATATATATATLASERSVKLGSESAGPPLPPRPTDAFTGATGRVIGEQKYLCSVPSSWPSNHFRSSWETDQSLNVLCSSFDSETINTRM